MAYSYNGNGSSWYSDTTPPDTGNSSSQWNATASISQASNSVYNRNLTTAPGAGGELETTGTETQSVAANGDANSTYDSQWTGTWTWTSGGDGRTDSSGGTYHNVTHDDDYYSYSNSVTYNADGTTTSTTSSGNNVSGTNIGNSTGWRSWSQWSSGCGSGSSSSSSSSSSWSASWSDSYSESVNYPGFYDGAYYGSGSASGGGASGGPLDYIGDAFNGGSGSGFGFYMSGMSDGMMMAMTAQEPNAMATEGKKQAIDRFMASLADATSELPAIAWYANGGEEAGQPMMAAAAEAEACEHGEKGSIPQGFLGRTSSPPKHEVLRGVPLLNGEGLNKLPPGVTRIGASGGEWWRGVITKGVVAGPTGCGPCVGVILIPSDPTRPTYVFHFASTHAIHGGFVAAGAV